MKINHCNRKLADLAKASAFPDLTVPILLCDSSLIICSKTSSANNCLPPCSVGKGLEKLLPKEAVEKLKGNIDKPLKIALPFGCFEAFPGEIEGESYLLMVYDDGIISFVSRLRRDTSDAVCGCFFQRIAETAKTALQTPAEARRGIDRSAEYINRIKKYMLSAIDDEKRRFFSVSSCKIISADSLLKCFFDCASPAMTAYGFRRITDAGSPDSADFRLESSEPAMMLLALLCVSVLYLSSDKTLHTALVNDSEDNRFLLVLSTDVNMENTSAPHPVCDFSDKSKTGKHFPFAAEAAMSQEIADNAGWRVSYTVSEGRLEIRCSIPNLKDDRNIARFSSGDQVFSLLKSCLDMLLSDLADH